MTWFGKWVLMTSAATLAMAGQASAQYQVNNGNALDANNQLGSGGYNASTPRSALNQNQIVTGNVTGGREFRGNVPYGDERSFRGPTGGAEVDRFIRGSTGVTTAGNVTMNSQVVRPFYGESEVVAPPPGFTRLPGGAGYIPAEPIRYNPVDSRIQGNLGTLSAEAIANTGITNQPVATAQPSRLMRFDQMSPTQLASTVQDYQVLSPYTTIYRDSAPGGFDFETLQDYQRQLIRGSDLESEPGQPLSSAIDGRVSERTDSPTSAQLDGTSGAPGTDRMSATNALDPDLSMEMSDVQGLPAPEVQSQAYAKLQQRLDRFYGDIATERRGQNAVTGADQDPAADTGDAPATPVRDVDALPDEAQQVQDLTARVRDANQDDQDPMQAGEAPKSGLNDGGLSGALSGKAGAEPVKLSSLAQGVAGRGLAELLSSAETLMQEGKFQSAVETYEAAELVAPNNPLVRLGRGHAELSASYYRRAARTLRDALQSDAALMMGQYDLRAMIGEARLQTLVGELRQLANEQPSDPTPVFLLGYISYNTGFTGNAAGYLDLADQRAGAGRDPFYGNLKAHWSMSPAKPADEGK